MTESYRWRRPVLKLGSSTLTDGAGRLSMARLAAVVESVSVLRRAGLQPVVVSSGAVAAGRQRLAGLEERSLTQKQMLAAVGQSRLMHLYDQIFDYQGIATAQVLLTRADIDSRARYGSARATLTGLLAQGVVPVVNENDVVASDEIRVGDNDTLSALVAGLVDADLLVLVSDVPGLYTADPSLDAAARLLAEVPLLTAEIEALGGGPRSGVGTGGMATKLAAARIATAAGAEVRIVDGREPEVILRVLRGEAIGTRFPARQAPVEGRKRWILSGLRPNRRVAVDWGAVRALLHGGASLLPAGIVAVAGDWERGDSVAVVDPSGSTIACGTANYTSVEVRAISGRRSAEIEGALGYSYGGHVVHRDDLVVLVMEEVGR